MNECGTQLLDRTYELLRERRQDLTLREISDGAGVKYDWLNKFAQQQIPNPGVIFVQALHDFLSAKQKAA